jgi:hypothetical protein
MSATAASGPEVMPAWSAYVIGVERVPQAERVREDPDADAVDAARSEAVVVRRDHAEQQPEAEPVQKDDEGVPAGQRAGIAPVQAGCRGWRDGHLDGVAAVNGSGRRSMLVCMTAAGGAPSVGALAPPDGAVGR